MLLDSYVKGENLSPLIFSELNTTSEMNFEFYLLQAEIQQHHHDRSVTQSPSEKTPCQNRSVLHKMAHMRTNIVQINIIYRTIKMSMNPMNFYHIKEESGRLSLLKVNCNQRLLWHHPTVWTLTDAVNRCCETENVLMLSCGVISSSMSQRCANAERLLQVEIWN